MSPARTKGRKANTFPGLAQAAHSANVPNLSRAFKALIPAKEPSCAPSLIFSVFAERLELSGKDLNTQLKLISWIKQLRCGPSPSKLFCQFQSRLCEGQHRLQSEGSPFNDLWWVLDKEEKRTWKRLAAEYRALYQEIERDFPMDKTHSFEAQMFALQEKIRSVLWKAEGL
ncbi:hypothetical protein CPB86DRAFT_845664 [Serendipita vermifera]|nr:hypothetical protein CPB86DRAFT_845664 [Serendipita vermifera]